MISKLKIATTVLSMSLLLSACGSKETNSSTDTVVEPTRMMMTAEVTSLNTAALLNDPDSIMHAAVFEGLYELNENEEIVPSLATELPEISDDGLVYTIPIRDNAKWTNGDSVTAHDFVFAWQEVINPDNGYVYSFLMSGIIKNAQKINEGELPVADLGVEALDDYTLKVELERPTPYFTSLLVFTTFNPVNEKAVKEFGDEYGTSFDKVVFNGPYTTDDWTQTSTGFTLKKNPEYWDVENVKSDEIQMDVIKESSTAFNLFEDGQLDVANLQGEMAMQNKDREDFKVYPTAKMNYIRLNQIRNGKETPLANENLRKALALSVDKETLVTNVVADGSVPLNGAITQGFVQNPVTKEDFREESGELLPYNEEEAKKYFELAKKELGDNISLELMTVDEGSYSKMAESMQGQWEETLDGLKVDLKPLPTESALNLSAESDYDLFLIYWTPDYQDPISTLNTLKSPNNRNYENAEYDALLDAATDKYATDEEARWAALLEAEKLVMEETAGMIAISQNSQSVLQSENITGLTYHTFASPILLKHVGKE